MKKGSKQYPIHRPIFVRVRVVVVKDLGAQMGAHKPKHYLRYSTTEQLSIIDKQT